METLYRTVDQSGISIPLEIVRSFGLSEGTRIAISWQKDGIRVAPAEVSAEEIENRALRFLLKNVGDAVGIGRLQRTAAGLWLAPVLEAATGQPIGQHRYAHLPPRPRPATTLTHRPARPPELGRNARRLVEQRYDWGRRRPTLRRSGRGDGAGAPSLVMRQVLR